MYLLSEQAYGHGGWKTAVRIKSKKRIRVMRKTLKNEYIPVSILLCIVFLVISVFAGLTIIETDKDGAYTSGSTITRLSGISIDVANRFGYEDNLSEEITSKTEGETIRPLFRYGRVLIYAIYVTVLFVSGFESQYFLPIQYCGYSHFFTINYLHDTDGRKRLLCVSQGL